MNELVKLILEKHKRGLWDNIHAKQERIKRGSGEHMKKPGEKGRPTKADFKQSQETSKIHEAELTVPLSTAGKRTVVSELQTVVISDVKGKIEKHPPGKSGSSGGGDE